MLFARLFITDGSFQVVMSAANRPPTCSSQVLASCYWLVEVKIRIVDEISSLSSPLYTFRIVHFSFLPSSFFELTAHFQAEEYIKSFNTSKITTLAGQNEEHLICQCENKLGIRSCVKGREVLVETAYWAGDGNDVIKLPVVNNGKQAVPNVSNFEELLRRQSLLISICYDNLCSSHNGLPWTLQKVNPCDKDKNRQGIVCGQCDEGFSRVPGLPSLVSKRGVHCQGSVFQTTKGLDGKFSGA